MRVLKKISIYLLLVASVTVIYSCSSESCEDVTCEYDGVCEDGECLCSDVTTNYLVGTWIIESTGNVVGTFNSDNTYIDSFGNEVTWSLDASTNTITFTPGNTLIISGTEFSCTQMNVTIDNGTTQTAFTFLRQ